MTREFVQKFVSLRRNHPAWLLLASPKGPLILASLKGLMDANPGGVDFEEAVERLAGVFADNANDSEFDLGDDHAMSARRELRQWLKRGLIVERSGKILANRLISYCGSTRIVAWRFSRWHRVAQKLLPMKMDGVIPSFANKGLRLSSRCW